MNTVDIAIVGAGLVGTPLAQVLSQQGWSVALLDAAGPVSKATVAAGNGVTSNAVDASAIDASAEKNNTSLKQRCTALSLGTSQWLSSRDLWADVAADACAISQVHVSHKGYFGSTRLCAEELNAEAVGYVVNNDTLARTFQLQLKRSDVQHVHHARVSAVSYDEDVVTVHYGNDDSHQMQAKLLIAADGVSSLVRESAGIDTRQVDYDQLAVLGTIELSGEHHHVAYERFTSSGPLALLPRPGPYMSFVDCIEPHEREAVLMMGSNEYLQRLQQRFGHRLGRFKAVGPRMVTPLVRIEACEQIAERTVLLGNAMRLLHPVGGQGYNLAMRDVAQLVALLQQNTDADPGNELLLSQFVQRRQKDQNQVVTFTDVLARGFRGNASLPAHVRAFGLISLDAVSPLREAFARRTMGLS